MLTELRDINSRRSPPLIYYMIGYVLPLVSTGLTLGLRQDLFTNYDDSSALTIIQSSSGPTQIHRLDGIASLFCWLNVHQPTDIVYSLILPISFILAVFICSAALVYRQLRRRNLKQQQQQTDPKLVPHSLIAALLLLPFMSGTTMFMFMFLTTSSSLTAAPTSGHAGQFQWSESAVYEACYLVCLLVFASGAFGLFVLMHKTVRDDLVKLWNKALDALLRSDDDKNDKKKKKKKSVAGKNSQIKSNTDTFDGFIGVKPKHGGNLAAADFVDVAEIKAANNNKFISELSFFCYYFLNDLRFNGVKMVHWLV